MVDLFVTMLQISLGRSVLTLMMNS
jgi:hypothetical protein